MSEFFTRVPDSTKKKKPRFPKARIEPNQYSEPAGPARQPTFAEKLKAKVSGTASNFGEKVKKRVSNIDVGQTLSNIHDNLEASAAREQGQQRSSRRSRSSDVGGFAMPSFGPPMGGGFEIAPPPAWMTGMGSPEPQRQAAPRKGKKKKKSYTAREPEPTWQDLSGVPESVKRWM